ncbi:MAG: ribosomal protein L13e, partial [Candidatus Thorarchaeota archaeon]
MSFEIIAEPTVKTPKTSRPRRGRGFSREETSQAGLTIQDARKMGLIVDLRRKSCYPENIEALKQYMKDLEEIIAALDKDEGVTISASKAPTADNAIAELSSLRAVKVSEAPLLVDAGIKSMSDLAYCDIPKVAKKTGIDEARITAMV